MPLSRLNVSNLRNLGSVQLNPAPSLNFIYGANGSGKTSLLEAIYLSATGRSFRSSKLKPVVNFQSSSFVIYSEVRLGDTSFKIGLERGDKGVSTTRVNGRNLTSAAQLASLLPVQLVDAHSFDLIEGPPKTRRGFLDWLVFHVKPSFLPLWKAYRTALKQRNSLLRRDRIDPFELQPWDTELCASAAAIDALRSDCFDKLNSIFNEVVADFLPLEGIEITYYRGWESRSELSTVLDDGKERDQKLGYTWYGAHKAEIKIKINGMAADQALSRGQQKLLICALKISIGRALTELKGLQCLYLVDDLPAELDKSNQKRLAKWLIDINAQVFVTAVEQQSLITAWAEAAETEVSMFHVEHGDVKQSFE